MRNLTLIFNSHTIKDLLFFTDNTRGGRKNPIEFGNTDLRDRYMYQTCTAYVLPYNS